MSSIARNLDKAIDRQFPRRDQSPPRAFPTGRSRESLAALLASEGSEVTATSSGYLQFVSYGRLVDVASRHDAVVQLLYRPGHFVTHGLPLARVWPPATADVMIPALDRGHITGPHRTLDQDAVFAIDQLVEISIRALSPAVNDTFTALTCIDWLADGLCTISARSLPDGAHRDRGGEIRVIEPGPRYDRMVNRAHDKVRQAGAGMPAVLIRLLKSLGRVLAYTHYDWQAAVLMRQADMIWRSCQSSLREPEDLATARDRYEQLDGLLGNVPATERLND
jgi:uncharacterized membrane protein